MQNNININDYILESHFAHYKSEDKEVWDLENPSCMFHLFLVRCNEFSYFENSLPILLLEFIWFQSSKKYFAMQWVKQHSQVNNRNLLLCQTLIVTLYI